MQIYLVQHGLSLPKDQDPQKGLSTKGIEEVNRIADVAKMYNVKVAKILHSGKKRAEQTAEIFSKAIVPKEGVSVCEGINPMDDVVVFGDHLKNLNETMIVGHLPFMEKLVSVLTAKSDELRVFKFQNSGIVCLEFDAEKDFWSIKWTLMPNIG